MSAPVKIQSRPVILRIGSSEPVPTSVFAKFFALAHIFESPCPKIHIVDDDGREEWVELHEEHPAIVERLPALSPIKW